MIKKPTNFETETDMSENAKITNLKFLHCSDIHLDSPFFDVTPEKSEERRRELAKEISKVCGRRFAPPMVATVQDRCRIQMSEKPVYRVQFGVAQHACGNAQLCGDSYDCFTDGKSRICVTRR